MLRNWFKSKRSVSIASVRDATGDLERFLLALKGMSDEEIGTLVAMAAVLRMELREQNLFPDAALGVGTPLPEREQGTLQANLSRMVLDLQKNNSPNAGAAMVWLHSLRAFRYPEVRLLGRQMWGELERGFPHVLEALGFMERPVGQPLPLGALRAGRFIPVGLEPFGRE
jgi:hypothetical protein